MSFAVEDSIHGGVVAHLSYKTDLVITTLVREYVIIKASFDCRECYAVHMNVILGKKTRHRRRENDKKDTHDKSSFAVGAFEA